MRWFNKSSLGLLEEAFRRRGRLLILVVAALMLVLLAALAYVVLMDKSGSGNSEKNAYLLLADFSTNKAIVQDASGKAIASANFPYPSSYVTYHAITPGGAVLMSVGGGTSDEAFFFANRERKDEISPKASKVLATTVTFNGKRNINFINEDTALFVSCLAGETCKLSQVAINSGESNLIADTGVGSLPFSPVYILGVSGDKKSIYLRISGTNKLGSENSAVYKFDLETKKATLTIKLPSDAGQALTLSPDEKRLVYKTGGLGKEVEFTVVDILSGKQTKTTWSKAEISNSPSALVWSPDSRKVLFLASSGIIRATAAADNPQKLAYLDTKDNKITELQTINKTYLKGIFYYSWLDNGTIIYGQAVTAKENDFANAKKEVYKQEAQSKEISKVETSAQLQEVLFW